jgi:hypothetical protein
MFHTFTRPAWTLVALTVFAPAVHALSVIADFDNANAVVRSIDAENRVVAVAPRTVREARNIWWHFRIEGLRPGETVEIRIEDFDRVANEIHPVYSYDRLTWHRFDDRTTPYRQRFDESAVWIARNLPFSYADSLDLAGELARGPHADILTLCLSEEGRPVKMIRFGDSGGENQRRPMVWVQARQHAFESHSSRIAAGLARWLAGASPQAEELRKHALIYIVPIMDVDSVATGGAGKDQQPVDFNRAWTEDSPWTAVRAAIAAIDRARANNAFTVFLDLHNPWYHETSHWHLWGSDRIMRNNTAFADRFAAILARSSPPNSWENRQVRHERAPYDARSQRFIAKNRLGDTPDGVSLTMEAPHWKDADGRFITAEGLEAFGVALGLALHETLVAGARVQR